MDRTGRTGLILLGNILENRQSILSRADGTPVIPSDIAHSILYINIYAFALYTDISIFPIHRQRLGVLCIASIFLTLHSFTTRAEIIVCDATSVLHCVTVQDER